VSALGLQNVQGLGSYQTAWTMLHRFRRAMVRPGREFLSGLVEVDETYIAIGDKSIPAGGKRRHPKINKTAVVIAVEMIELKGFGRIRLKRITAYQKVRSSVCKRRHSSWVNCTYRRLSCV
jgi:hypothetical protein